MSFFKKTKYALKVMFCLLLLNLGMPLQAADFSEDQVKAVYLFNFAGFIRWPESAFVETPEQFQFCAFNDENNVIILLKKVISNESIKGRKLVFHLVNPNEGLKNCHILFLPSTQLSKITEFFESKQKNMLTVSDDDDFANQGGMISFIRKKKRLRSAINVSRLESVGLKASSKLLRIATIVGKK